MLRRAPVTKRRPWRTGAKPLGGGPRGPVEVGAKERGSVEQHARLGSGGGENEEEETCPYGPGRLS